MQDRAGSPSSCPPPELQSSPDDGAKHFPQTISWDLSPPESGGPWRLTWSWPECTWLSRPAIVSQSVIVMLVLAWQYRHLSLVPQAELSHQLQLLVKSGLLERSPGSCISLPILLGNLPVDHAVTLSLSQSLKTQTSVSTITIKQSYSKSLCREDCSGECGSSQSWASDWFSPPQSVACWDGKMPAISFLYPLSKSRQYYIVSECQRYIIAYISPE